MNIELNLVLGIQSLNDLPFVGDGICDARLGPISVKWVFRAFAISFDCVTDSHDVKLILLISTVLDF